METIVGIEIFPLISFIIFFAFFVGLIIYVMKLSKASVEEMSSIPLNDSFDTNNANISSHE